jgi:hypothetical protein
MAAGLSSTARYASLITSMSGPYSYGAWFNPSSLGNSYQVFITFDAVATVFSQLFVSSSNDRLQLRNSVSLIASPAPAVSANTWQHALAVCPTSNTAAVYLNGGSKATGSLNPTTPIESLTLSNTSSSAFSVAEAAIWNAELDDTDAAILAAGVSPLLVRPRNLVYYAPLIRAAQDIRRGVALTATGTPTVTDHPRMIYPSSEIGISHKQQTEIARSASNSFLFGQNADLTEITRSAQSSFSFAQGTFPPFAELLASNSFAFSQDQIPFQDVQQSILFSGQAVTPEVVRALVQSINFKQQIKAVVGNIASGRYRR